MTNHVARRWVLGATAVLGLTFAGVAAAQAPTFFRIGTGGTAGTYFPIGGLIANAISGSEGKGVPGLAYLHAVDPRDDGRVERFGRQHQRGPGRLVGIRLHAV